MQASSRSLDYYPLVDNNGNITEFAEVEALDECKTDDDEKYCTKKLKIGAKINFSKLVQASVEFDYEKNVKTHNEDDECISSKGYSAQIGSSGYLAKIGSSGYLAQIGSSGDSAQITSEGKYAVICCAGNDSKVKAKKGSWITLAEWKYDDKERISSPKCVKTEFVDGERIKEDTFYKLIDGQFVEV